MKGNAYTFFCYPGKDQICLFFKVSGKENLSFKYEADMTKIQHWHSSNVRKWFFL